MGKYILITGGAGYIGSFLAAALLKEGHSVRILDEKKPHQLAEKVECIQTTSYDRFIWEKALDGIDIVIHNIGAHHDDELEKNIAETTAKNVLATASMLDVLANQKNKVEQIILAGTIKTYGEGMYRCRQHGECRPGLRYEKHMSALCFEPICTQCPKTLEPFPISEEEASDPATLYALTKKMQEDLILHFGDMHDIMTSVLRLGSVYGPHIPHDESVIAHILEKLENNEAPIIYEDGLQSKDFIAVHDTVRAFLLAISSEKADGEIINIASEKPTTILHLAKTLTNLLGKNIEPSITGQCKTSDIRHCIAEITKAKEILGWEPFISFEEGMKELVETHASLQA